MFSLFKKRRKSPNGLTVLNEGHVNKYGKKYNRIFVEGHGELLCNTSGATAEPGAINYYYPLSENGWETALEKADEKFRPYREEDLVPSQF